MVLVLASVLFAAAVVAGYWHFNHRDYRRKAK